MADALEFFGSEFERETNAHDDYVEALLAVLRGSYGLTGAGRPAQSGSRR